MDGFSEVSQRAAIREISGKPSTTLNYPEPSIFQA
jgi:hypothetical protein